MSYKPPFVVVLTTFLASLGQKQASSRNFTCTRWPHIPLRPLYIKENDVYLSYFSVEGLTHGSPYTHEETLKNC